MRFDFYERLSASPEFLDWRKKNPRAYLSHCYCLLDDSFKQTSPWEIGFYLPRQDKITIFVIEKQITQRPAEEIYRAPGLLVQELDLKKIKTSLPEALALFQKARQKHYPREILFKGFLILQNFQDKNIWNLSFITRSFRILNVKIDAADKKIFSHQLMDFIERKAG